MSHRTKRLVELDGLRGLAAGTVVIYHILHRYGHLYGHPFAVPDWLKYGASGVSLFFMISGFVIYWSASNSKRPLDFAWARASRLYPTYWLALIITFLAVSTLGLPGRETNIAQFVCNFTMLQGFAGIAHVDGVYWTLTVELALYFWIFTLLQLKQLHRVDAFMLVGVAAAALTKELAPHITNNPFLSNILLIHHINVFALGIASFRVWNREATPMTWGLLGAAFLSCLATLPKVDCAIIAFIFIVLNAGIYGRASWLRNPALVWVGKISYPLYLTHQNIGYISIKRLYELNIPPVWAILTTLTFLLAIAYGMHRWVEQPSGKWLKSIYKNYFQAN